MDTIVYKPIYPLLKRTYRRLILSKVMNERV